MAPSMDVMPPARAALGAGAEIGLAPFGLCAPEGLDAPAPFGCALAPAKPCPAPTAAGAPRAAADAGCKAAPPVPLAAAPAIPAAAPAQAPAHGPPYQATPALSTAARAVLGLFGAERAAAGCPAGVAAAASGLISRWGLDDTFYVFDFGEVARLHAAWTAALPRVQPFYAVKCNPEPGLMAMLDALGCGFDCASVDELQRAAALGVPQSRVIFANPCKRAADFRYAAERGVEYTTFDCASELEKIAAGYPGFKCILRIRCDDETCKINLGLKYGADPGDDVLHLLALARDLGLKVVGVSFHVGSGCQNVSVYEDAIRRAREAFDAAPAYGFDDMHLLDIGGGFTAPYDPASADLFYRTAAVVNGALAEHFPPGCGVRVIAEPGRFFAETTATLFTTVLGSRRCGGAGSAGGSPKAPGSPTAAAGGAAPAPAAAAPAPEPPLYEYTLSDSTYGSFRIQVAVDGLEPSYTVLRSPLLPPPPPALEAPAPARLRGDSGRDGDVVHAAARLPLLREGDYLAFPYAGAYTICSASRFGGGRMAEPTKLFIWSAGAARDLGRYNDPAARAAAPASASAAAALAAAEAAEALRALCVQEAVIAAACNEDAMSTGSGASEATVLEGGCGGCADGNAAAAGPCGPSGVDALMCDGSTGGPMAVGGAL